MEMMLISPLHDLLNIQLLYILLCLGGDITNKRGPKNAVFGVSGDVCLCPLGLEPPVSLDGQSLPHSLSISISLISAI